MKTKTTYICEVCGWDHPTADQAEACEVRPRGTKYPVGMIFGDCSRGAFYKNMCFAVAVNRVEGHQNNGALWACRDNGAGDSRTKKDLCGWQSIRPTEHDKPDPRVPSFKRIVSLVQKFGISENAITVWDGKQPVGLKQFLKGNR